MGLRKARCGGSLTGILFCSTRMGRLAVNLKILPGWGSLMTSSTLEFPSFLIWWMPCFLLHSSQGGTHLLGPGEGFHEAMYVQAPFKLPLSVGIIHTNPGLSLHCFQSLHSSLTRCVSSFCFIFGPVVLRAYPCPFAQ